MSEGPPLDPVPCCEAVRALDHGVDEEADVFEHPRGDRVVDGDGLVDAGFGAQLNRAEEPANKPHASLDVAVRLGVVARRKTRSFMRAELEIAISKFGIEVLFIAIEYSAWYSDMRSLR